MRIRSVVLDVCRPQYVLLAGGVGDRLAAAAVPVAAPPLVCVADRRRSGPAAGVRRQRLTDHRRARDRRRDEVVRLRVSLHDPGRVGRGRCLPLRVRGDHPHAQAEPDVGVPHAIRVVRGVTDHEAVRAVRCTAVGPAAEPPVRERHRRRPGPRARARGQEPAVRGVPRDPGLAGVCRSSVCPRRSRAGQHRSRHSGNDGEWSNSPEQRSCVSRANTCICMHLLDSVSTPVRTRLNRIERSERRRFAGVFPRANDSLTWRGRKEVAARCRLMRKWSA